MYLCRWAGGNGVVPVARLTQSDSGRCENAMTGKPAGQPFSHSLSVARLFLVGAGGVVAVVVSLGWFGAVSGRCLLFWVQAWEGKVRDFMHLVVPRKCVERLRKARVAY